MKKIFEQSPYFPNSNKLKDHIIILFSLLFSLLTIISHPELVPIFFINLI